MPNSPFNLPVRNTSTEGQPSNHTSTHIQMSKVGISASSIIKLIVMFFMIVFGIVTISLLCVMIYKLDILIREIRSANALLKEVNPETISSVIEALNSFSTLQPTLHTLGNMVTSGSTTFSTFIKNLASTLNQLVS